MKDKSEISYVIEAAGDLEEISLLTTDAIKVPEVGEVIHINTKFDFDELKMRHSDLTEEQISNFLPSEEKRVKGNFVVTDVKRWLDIRYTKDNVEYFSIGTIATLAKEVPTQRIIETFEVYIKPVK